MKSCADAVSVSSENGTTERAARFPAVKGPKYCSATDME